MRSLLIGVAACLAACHLAEDADPMTCPAGAHLERGYCVGDPSVGPVISIKTDTEAGAGCVVSPDSISVAVGAYFSFKNDDSVEHVVTGADGTAWATVKSGQPSPLVNISAAGSFPYVVSGCAKGGTVVVQ